jgi:ribosomal protein S18 acetylase RimI-like enzyme
MKVSTTTLRHLVAVALLGALASPLHAWEPNAKELDAAINSGDIAGYLTSATTWLNQKAAAKPDESALATLLRDPAFRAVIDQRQLIAKTGADQLAAYAKAAPANAAFLGWLLRNATAMDLYLEAATPTGLVALEENTWTLKTDARRSGRKSSRPTPSRKTACI